MRGGDPNTAGDAAGDEVVSWDPMSGRACVRAEPETPVADLPSEENSPMGAPN